MAMTTVGSTKGMADDGSSDHNPIADSYGSLTQTAGTVITRLIPPRTSLRARITDMIYTAGTTAHTVSIMPTLVEGQITQDANSGQAVINVDTIPTNPFDSGILAGSDWVSFKYEDGTWEHTTVSSVSAAAITLVANLSRNVDANTKIYYHFAPADHTNRRITAAASATLNIANGNVCTAPTKSQPIIVHSDNATVAGTLVKVGYTYVDGNPA